MFPAGLCGAVHRDGRVAVPPRYDWVGQFAEGRAAVRAGGRYGFVDEEGREVVKPTYRIVDDYKFGFAQVDVEGKSGVYRVVEGRAKFTPVETGADVQGQTEIVKGLQGGERLISVAALSRPLKDGDRVRIEGEKE